jgi:hypothetical protein
MSELFKIELRKQIKQGEDKLKEQKVDSNYWIYILNRYSDESRTLKYLTRGSFFENNYFIMELIDDKNLNDTEFYTCKVFDIRELETWTLYMTDSDEIEYAANGMKHRGLKYSLYLDRITNIVKKKEREAFQEAEQAEKRRKYESNLLDDIRIIQYNDKEIQLVNYSRDKYSPLYRDKSLVWSVSNFTCLGIKEDFIRAIKQMLDDLPELETKNNLKNTKDDICLLMIDGYFEYRPETTKMTVFCCMESNNARY